ncbi:hypothetical protein HYV30_02910 [Candidatus Kaiserbacteria bacterium]|nr:hypothetical protein [Candidatus Kaiserbacteria bacterium]
MKTNQILPSSNEKTSKKYLVMGSFMTSGLLLLGAILAIFIAGTLGFMYRQQIMSLLTKNTAPEIVEVRDFQCDGMEGFTFKYPVFKGWEASEKVECIDSASARSNLFEVHIIKGKDWDFETLENPSGIVYGRVYSSEEESAIFLGKESDVIVTLKNADNPEKSFSKDLFWQQVIESFKIVEVSQAVKFAGSWMWSEEAWGQDVDKLQPFLASEQFSLDLEVTGNNISGSHCWSKSYSVGEKTETQKDCGDQEKIPSITGKINGSTADVSFSSYTDGTTYLARLEYDSASDSLRWQITGYPKKISQSGFPAEVSLRRKLGTPL